MDSERLSIPTDLQPLCHFMAVQRTTLRMQCNLLKHYRKWGVQVGAGRDMPLPEAGVCPGLVPPPSLMVPGSV